MRAKLAMCFVAVPQGISGFPKPAIVGLTTSHVVRRDLLQRPTNPELIGIGGRDLQWRLGDGHLPEHQPRVPFSEAWEWVKANPTCIAYACPDMQATK
jgi:hypothetical protein